MNKNNDKTDITIETYDNIVDEYVEYFKTKDLRGKVQFQKEIDCICFRLDSNAKILDVGCAIGDYPKYLTEKCDKNFNVIGIDSSKNMIDVAKKNAPKAKFEVMDIRKLEFQKQTFDAIICFAVLIHLNDEECIEVLNKFDEIIKDKGLIAINVMEWIKDEKEIFEDEPFNPKYKTYFNRYKKQFFMDYFKNKNYTVLEMIDNPLYNSSKVKGKVADANQFSIIVRKE